MLMFGIIPNLGQDGEEGFLRHLHIADLLHAFLAALLLLKQLALTAHVTAIALGCDILTYLLHRLTGNDLGADRCLDGDIELLTGYQLLQLLTHPPTKGDGIVLMGQRREGIYRFAVEQDIQLGEFRGTEAVDMVLEMDFSLS